MTNLPFYVLILCCWGEKGTSVIPFLSLTTTHCYKQLCGHNFPPCDILPSVRIQEFPCWANRCHTHLICLFSEFESLFSQVGSTSIRDEKGEACCYRIRRPAVTLSNCAAELQGHLLPSNGREERRSSSPFHKQGEIWSKWQVWLCIPSSFLQPRLNCVWKCTALRTGSLQLWLVVETFLSCLVYIHFNAICLQDEDIKQEGTEDIQKVWFKVHYIHSFYNVFRLSYCITNKAHLKTYCFSKTTVCLIVW